MPKRTIWQDANGKFVKAPTGKIPKGYRKKTVFVTPAKNKSQKRIAKAAKSEASFSKILSKKLEKVDSKKITPSKTRHLRFKGPTDKHFVKKQKPHKGWMYYIAVYEGNTFIGYFKTKKLQKYTKTLAQEIIRDSEKIRFPLRKRVEFPLKGRTLKDALSIISFSGLAYGKTLRYELHLRGKNESDILEEIKIHHQGFLTFSTTYGKTYDEIFIEQLEKVIRGIMNSQRVRFTSREMILQIAKWKHPGCDKSWAMDRIKNYAHIVNVTGNIVGVID